MRIAFSDICFYVSVHILVIVLYFSIFFLSWIDLPFTRSVEHVFFWGETCFDHEGVLVLLCLNVFLNTGTLLADVF